MAATGSTLTEHLLAEHNKSEKLSDESLLELYTSTTKDIVETADIDALASQENSVIRQRIIDDLKHAIRLLDTAIEQQIEVLESHFRQPEDGQPQEVDLLSLVSRKAFKDELLERETDEIPHLSQASNIEQCIQKLEADENTEAVKAINVIRDNVKGYYELKKLQGMAEVDPSHIPDSITDKDWYRESIEKFSDNVVYISNASLALQHGEKTHDLFHAFSSDMAILGTIGLVLQTYSLSKQMMKKDKTHEDKMDLALNAANFSENLVNYPTAMVGLLQQCHAHLSASAMSGFSAVASASSGPLLGVSALLLGATAYYYHKMGKEIDEIKAKQNTTMQEALDKAGIDIRVDDLSKADRKTLLKTIIHPENLTEKEKESDIYKESHEKLSQWNETDPKSANEAKMSLYHDKLKIDGIKEKRTDAKRNMAVQAITTALTAVTVAFPPSAIATFPIIAVVNMGNFLYGLAKKRKQKKAKDKLKTEGKEAQLEKDQQDQLDMVGTQESKVDELTEGSDHLSTSQGDISVIAGSKQKDHPGTPPRKPADLDEGSSVTSEDPVQNEKEEDEGSTSDSPHV